MPTPSISIFGLGTLAFAAGFFSFIAYLTRRAMQRKGELESVGAKHLFFPLRNLTMFLLCSAALITMVIWSSLLAEGPRRPIAPAEHSPAAWDSPSPYHKPLLPISGRDVAGLTLAVLGLLLASGGGIGGGGMLVPLYILVLQFSDRLAIPLSNLTILGGACANIILYWNRRHPHADRPLIDFDLALAMEPLTITGAIAGSMINKLLPGIVVTVLLVIVLGFTAHRTLSKAFKMWRAESAPTESIPLLPRKRGEYGTKAKDGLDSILQAERGVPWDKIMVLVLLFVGCNILNYLKGGPAVLAINPLWIQCGDDLYWMLLGAQVPWCLLVALLVRSHLLRVHQSRVEAGYQFRKGDIVWNDTTTIKYPAICSLAGLFAGLFGIGGGIVKGPLMLEMGVHPEVAAATTAFMILFTTASSSLSYALFGLLTYDYGFLLLIIGFCATYIGQIAMTRAVAHFGRPSLVAMVIGGTIAVSTVLMGIHGVMNAEKAWGEGNLLSHPPFCTGRPLYSDFDQ